MSEPDNPRHVPRPQKTRIAASGREPRERPWLTRSFPENTWKGFGWINASCWVAVLALIGFVFYVWRGW